MAQRRKRTERGENSRVAEALGERLPAILVDSKRRVIAVSPGAVRDFGIRAEAWIGHLVDEFLPRTPESSLVVKRRPAVPKRTDLTRGNARTVRAAPSEERTFGGPEDPIARRLEVVAVALPSGDQWLYLIDRTEQVRARAECLHLGQLAAAGRLISGIVHEINNPLSGIIGYVQLLLLRDHDREIRLALEKVQSEALRSSQIVRNLLDFSRRRAPVEGAVDIGAVARKALELKAHDLRLHNVTVQVDLPRSLPKVSGDPHQFLQVFVNLVANAEQAMYESDRGGRITIRGSAGKQDVVLTLSDTGPGIPGKLRDRIFDPFFTTKAEGKGTGLGLGLCREILHRLGGSIHLCDSSDSGATFEMHLRLAATQGAVEKGAKRKKPTFVRGHRLLVVEDDPVCRSFVTEAFESSGNEVHAFDRSEAALKFLQSRSVDVIISDLHRPGPNGLEFHAQVNKLDEQLARRILFLTGDTMNHELARVLASTGNPVLAKPVELHELHFAVQSLIATPSSRQRARKSHATGDE